MGVVCKGKSYWLVPAALLVLDHATRIASGMACSLTTGATAEAVLKPGQVSLRIRPLLT